MITYISILRGINVGGKNLIKMDLLRKSYEGLGFLNVRTYVQSGNVIFSGKSINPKELERILSQQIEKEFGFKVPIIVLTIEQLNRIIEEHPFIKESNLDPASMYITFLSSKRDPFDQLAIENKKQHQEKVAILEDVVYLYCPQGYGKTKLTNNFLESKLNVAGTTRNWRTTLELLKIAKTTP